MPTRETVMTALLARVSAAAGFATIQRHITFDPVQGPTAQVATPDAQPALYMLEAGESADWPGRGLPRRTWRVQLWVWARLPGGSTLGVPDGTTPGATVLNNLVEAIEASLAPSALAGDDPMVCTLGGLVQHCWIEGELAKVPGDINPDGQCFAAIPIAMLIP